MGAHDQNIVHLKNGLFAETSASDLEALFQALGASSDTDKVLVHFHGGLVSRKDGIGIAERLSGAYSSAGAYPFFFIWESAWHEAILNNLSEIVEEDFFQGLLRLITRKAIEKLGVDEAGTRGLMSPDQVRIELEKTSANEEPFAAVVPSALAEDAEIDASEEEAFEDEVKQDPDLGNAVTAIVEEIDRSAGQSTGRGIGLGKTRLSPEVLDSIKGERDQPADRAIVIPTRILKGAVIALVKVIARFAKRRDHGVHATIIEEIVREFYLGAFIKRVWDLIKNDTSDAFGPDPLRYGGTAMLANLTKLWKAGHRPRLVLVGHSAGSVYICHWLKAADPILPPDAKFDVILLAPACTVQLFAKTLESCRHRIANFRMFSMNDELEQKDAMISSVRLVYPRSLLYFVSGILEEGADAPILGMQRFCLGVGRFGQDKFPELGAVREFFAAVPGSCVWSLQNGQPGLSSSSQSHGAFDDDHDTIASIQHILQNGFAS